MGLGNNNPTIQARVFFPAVAQVGIASGVALNQSGITFSGRPGLVLAIWLTRFTQAAAIISNQNEMRLVTTEGLIIGHSGGMWFDATIGREHGALTWGAWLNPRAGGTANLETLLAATTVSVAAGAGRLIVLSWPTIVQEGPVVTFE